jgi:GDP-mannose 4,6-dehydratase
MYACNGILFNHESPRRGEIFVTRKITRGLANIALGLESCLHIGNIDALRGWGHAKDYVRMQWMMLQQDEAKDYVIATGKQYSVREFITWSANPLGIDIEFKGSGLDEVGVVTGLSGDLTPKISVGQKIVTLYPHSSYVSMRLKKTIMMKSSFGALVLPCENFCTSTTWLTRACLYKILNTQFMKKILSRCYVI